MLCCDHSPGDRAAVAAELATAAKSGSIAELVSSGVFSSISAALNDAKNANAREGALLAIAALAGSVGRPAEAYLMPLLGQVLTLLADKAAPVRTAAASAQVCVCGWLIAGGNEGALVMVVVGWERLWCRACWGQNHLTAAVVGVLRCHAPAAHNISFDPHRTDLSIATSCPPVLSNLLSLSSCFLPCLLHAVCPGGADVPPRCGCSAAHPV